MKAKILTTNQEKSNGVMDRDSLDDDEVYIFLNIFQNTGFHMKTVKFPLDLIHLNKNCEILRIDTMEPDTNELFMPPVGVNFSVEANKGYCSKNNIKVGDFWKEIHNRINNKEF